MDFLKSLSTFCLIESDKYEIGVYILQFHFNWGVTTIRIGLQDSTNAHLVITNMTTLPESARRRGFGSHAVSLLIQYALMHNLIDIRAVQVQKGIPAAFWEKNGFTPMNNATCDYKYTKS